MQLYTCTCGYVHVHVHAITFTYNGCILPCTGTLCTPIRVNNYCTCLKHSQYLTIITINSLQLVCINFQYLHGLQSLLSLIFCRPFGCCTPRVWRRGPVKISQTRQLMLWFPTTSEVHVVTIEITTGHEWLDKRSLSHESTRSGIHQVLIAVMTNVIYSYYTHAVCTIRPSLDPRREDLVSTVCVYMVQCLCMCKLTLKTW